MHGAKLAWLGGAVALGTALALTGCGKGPTLDLPGPRDEPPADAGANFDSHTAGTIEGHVTWEGDPPRVPPFRARVSPLSEQPSLEKLDWPNPNAPVLGGRAGRAVVGAVVYLKDVDPRRGRPWDHPPARVELRDFQIRVRQGDVEHTTGFVRRGTAVEMVSRQPRFHSLRARGDAFFTLPFPDRDQPQARRLDRAGVVELSSGAGQFWMRSYLFVSDHPYYTHTGPDGSFRLPQVPPGDYQLVLWMPNWLPAERELDADTWQITRLGFQPPLVKSRPVRVKAGAEVPMGFFVSEEEFRRPDSAN
jgi:hypothetical protein